MLTVRERGILRYRYIISDEGNEVPLRVTGMLPRRGEMEIGEDRFGIYREGRFSGRFVLERNGLPIAHADRPRAFRDHFVITVGNLTFEVSREERFDSRLTVRWHGETLGTISRGRKKILALIDLPDSIAFELRVFCFWLAKSVWDRYAFFGVFGA